MDRIDETFRDKFWREHNQITSLRGLEKYKAGLSILLFAVVSLFASIAISYFLAGILYAALAMVFQWEMGDFVHLIAGAFFLFFAPTIMFDAYLRERSELVKISEGR